MPFQQVLPKASPQAIDLLEHLLKFDPAERISAAEALQHPYFSTALPTPTPFGLNPTPAAMPAPVYNYPHPQQYQQQAAQQQQQQGQPWHQVPQGHGQQQQQFMVPIPGPQTAPGQHVMHMVRYPLPANTGQQQPAQFGQPTYPANYNHGGRQ